MAWSYADYETESTDAARLTKLRQHIAEVEAAVGADTSAHGYSRSNSSLESKLTRLHQRRQELERSVGSSAPAVGLMDLRG